MKKTVTILILLFTAVIGFAQTDSIRGNKFELKGKIINETPSTAHCGIIAWAVVIELEIIEFSKSDYKLDAVGVIFTCPEMYGEEFFEKGKTYTLTLTDEKRANFSWTIPNASTLTKYNLDKMLWVISAVKKE